MDKKLRKSRISNFIAYEWILLVVIAVVGILVWELIYSVSAVRLSVGQEFKYYYDVGLYAKGAKNLNTRLIDEDTFSYDVLEVGYESLTSDYNMLSTRLSVYEGDAIFSEIEPDEVEEGKYQTNATNDLIDDVNYGVYDYDSLCADAEEYLKGFLKTEGGDPLVYENLDETKIEACFNKRLKKDNRFRSEKQKKEGRELEKARIKKLCEDTAFLAKVLYYDANNLSSDDTIFYSYRKYEQTLNVLNSDDKNKSVYQKLYDEQTTLRYGLRLDRLTNDAGSAKVEDYIVTTAKGTSENVVLLIFDFEKKQPDLQFEAVSFAVQIIKTFSNQFNGL